MQDLRTLFESEYPGKEKLFEALIKPIFSKAKDTLLTPKQDLSDADKKQIKSFSIIAQVRGGFPIVFADVELQDTVALKRSRVGIQNCVRKVMENDSNAIIFFHFTDNAKEWRVSYVHRAETNRNSTSAKRYTYLCGPEHSCRTVSERFETLKGLATIKDEDMIEAFSVEPLSKDFFERYREQYADLVEYISGKRFVKKGGKFVEEKTINASGLFKNAFDGDDKAVRDFVKKMMGRLVFLQFLQKKGWLGVKTGDEWGSGDKNFLENLFKNAGKDVQDDFLEQALEELFFKTLNKSRGEEAIAPKKLCDIYGSSIRIPYLNGGLFEEDELDKKKVKFKKEHFASLFEFFNQYNFTIDETDPDDTEIGVDPEMLGKIFENLLEDNKDKGAFYTPKEIVQYMCRESLIAYLSEKIPAEEKVRNFVLTHEPSFTEMEKTDILNALLEVKVCDPAVGSGAFPMGMLNELLACTQALIGEAKSRAELKKHIVKNNIYGVDIEKGAVDIARLRFWLAIIVDEEEPLPLPNLDYKIMQGNSLLECYIYKISDGKDKDKEVTVDLSQMLAKPNDGSLDYTEEQRNLLKTNIDEYFGDNNHEDKRVKNDVIKSCVFDLACDTCGLKRNSENALALYEKIWNGTSDFFLWHTWFNDVFSRPQKQGGTKSGFDIVIGNPPYVSAPTQIANKQLAIQRERLAQSNRYKSLYQKWDLYIPFIELGMSLNNQNGITTMIVPFPLTNQLYAKVLRKIIVEDSNMFELADLNGTKIFENATVSNCIVFIQKSAPKEKTWISNINEKLEIKRTFEQSLSELVQDEKTQVWNVSQEKRKANKHSDMHVLGDFCYISKGMVLNSDESEKNKMFKKQDLISEIKDKIHCKKFIEGKNCGKYSINKIRYLEYNTERCPARLSRATFEQLYTTPKLMFNRLGELQVVIDEQGDFTTSDAMFVCLKWNSLLNVENKSITNSIKKFSNMARLEMEELSENVDLKYLLGIMNSKYAAVLLKNLRGDDYHIYPEHIRNIPIPIASKKQQQKIIALVEKILSAKKADANADTTGLEKQIDMLAYELYNLTTEEIDKF